jgi:type I restriction enzyme S subunit
MKRLTLGDVCKKASSNIAQKDLQDKMGAYPIYGASGLIKQVDFYQQDKEYIAVVKDGAGIGRTMLLPAYSSVIGTMQYLLPKEGIPIDIKYLFYAVEHMNLAKYFSGATIPHIYFKDYQKEPINIPDIDTQRKTSRIFDKIDALITSRKEQRTKLDQIVKSRFIEMFGDPKSNPNSYPISQLSEHIEFLTSGSRGWAQYCVDNGSEWFITIKNVKGCRISIDNMQPINAPDNAEAKRTKVQEGDLLISITADLGRTGVVTKEIADHGAYINQHLTCIRLNKEILNPLYVAFFMESPAGKEQFESKNQSAVKAGLNFNSINSLRLLVPPMDEQNAFVGFVHQIDKSKYRQEKCIGFFQCLEKSIRQEWL